MDFYERLSRAAAELFSRISILSSLGLLEGLLDHRSCDELPGLYPLNVEDLVADYVDFLDVFPRPLAAGFQENFEKPFPLAFVETLGKGLQVAEVLLFDIHGSSLVVAFSDIIATHDVFMYHLMIFIAFSDIIVKSFPDIFYFLLILLVLE